MTLTVPTWVQFVVFVVVENRMASGRARPVPMKMTKISCFIFVVAKLSFSQRDTKLQQRM